MASGNQDLLDQYQKSYQEIHARKLELEIEGNEKDVKLLESMERDLLYSMRVMKGELKPRGEILVDNNAFFDSVVANNWFTGLNLEEMEGEEEEQEEEVFADLESVLSSRESLCLLAFEEGLSFAEIALHLGVTRSTVQSYIERGRRKLKRADSVQMSLWNDSRYLGA